MDITTPAPAVKLTCDPAKKEVSFPLRVSQHTVMCRIPYYVLNLATNNSGGEPRALASEHFQIFLDAAICKVNRKRYEPDGTVLLMLMDLGDPVAANTLH